MALKQVVLSLMVDADSNVDAVNKAFKQYIENANINDLQFYVQDYDSTNEILSIDLGDDPIISRTRTNSWSEVLN